VTYYVGDKGPKTVPFAIDTGDVDGTTAASARVKVYTPAGAEVEWTPGTLTTAEDEVSFEVVLQSDGTSIATAGQYYARVWLYNSGGTVILDTDEQLLFTARARRLTWPT
jgi:hypothetical protein